MADLQKSTPAKRALPFKRTARQKPSNDASSPVDDDGLSLFSQSKNYFPTVVEDQQRRAREKAEKAEQERREKLAREKRKKEEEEEEEQEKERSSARKRRHLSLSGDEMPKYNDGDSDASFTDERPKSYKLSTPLSPETNTNVPAPGSSRASGGAAATRASRRSEASVILLDSSDDEDPTKKGSKASVTSSRTRSSRDQPQATHMNVTKGTAKVDDSDSDLEMWEEKKRDGAGADGEGAEDEEDPSEFYIKAAMERMQKAKEARLARGSSAVGDGGMHKSTTPGFDDDRGAPVSVMIAAPGLQDAKALCCTVRTSQPLQIAFDTFKERQKTQTTHPHKMISELVFTWRGDRVYHTTKLETLGIHPRGRDGRLHDNVHSGRSAPEGYMGKDKVYFEAWTPEEYEELQKKQDRERKLRETGGDWWTEKDTADDKDDDNGGQAAAAGAEVNTPSKEDDRIRVVFRARDMPPRNITVRKHSTVAQLIRAFRKVASLGEDKHIELRWDGEVLDHDTTVEEADIGDTDSVEVHIR